MEIKRTPSPAIIPANNSPFDSIESALEDIRQGKMIIVVDDEDRENEGDFVMAAEKVTAEHINFMATYGRGIICTPLTSQRAQELDLPLMVPQHNNSTFATPFTVSIDLLLDNSTGISCADRARTILALVSPQTKACDFMRPGHIFPLIAQDQGVLVRNGHTEAAVDLAKLAGLYPAGVICEIMNDDGSMSRVPDLIKLAQKFHMKLITIKDLVHYIQNSQNSQNKHQVVSKNGTIDFPTEFGHFELHLFTETNNHKILSSNSEEKNPHHLAIVKKTPGKLLGEGPTLVRIHSECLTGDVFASKRCDCGPQLHMSLQMIEEAGEGVVIYLRQEGRGIGLLNKIKAYELQEQGYDTVTANEALGLGPDSRDYQVAISILKELGIKEINLMTNNPHKVEEIKKSDLHVCSRIPLEVEANEINLHYLQTKRDKMGHLILGQEHQH